MVSTALRSDRSFVGTKEDVSRAATLRLFWPKGRSPAA
jgi:hypothetical protein